MVSEPADIAKRLRRLEEQLGVLSKSQRASGMLSSADFRKRVITRETSDNYAELKELFETRRWGELEDKEKSKGFIIDPYDALNLTPYSYDLAIGDEVFSCRSENRSSFVIGSRGDGEKSWHKIKPGETVVVRTQEYIALPQYYSATVWPRFNFVREGIFQSMVKIDPTWYGQLGVALTNMSPAEYPIWKGKRFATLIIYELLSPTDINLYHEGQTLLLPEDDPPLQTTLPQEIVEAVSAKISSGRFKGRCAIRDGRLVLLAALGDDDLTSLRDLAPDREWKRTVEAIVRTKECNALGLPALDLLLARPKAGDKDQRPERVDRKTVLALESSEVRTGLLDAAVERGKPFDLIAAIPEAVKDWTRDIVETELNRELSGILLRVMAVTISLLGFISLVVAIVALIARSLQWQFPANLDIDGSLIAGMLIVAVPLVLVLMYVFTLRVAPRGVRGVRKRLDGLDDRLTIEVGDVRSDLRNKMDALQKRISELEDKLRDTSARPATRDTVE